MIRFENVWKSYGSQVLLRDVSFRVHPGERAGVVGPNGAGKTTVFQLISGGVSPDRGRVVVRNHARLGHVRQEPPATEFSGSLVEYVEVGAGEIRDIQAELAQLEAELQTSPNAGGRGCLERIGELQTRLEHLGAYALRSRAEKVLMGLEFDRDALERPLREFSGGWRMRAELARALVAEPDVLLLDEPTNYLDLPAVEWLRDFLRGFRGTLLLISHDRFLLNALTRVTFEVAGGLVTRYAGNYSTYIQAREKRRIQAEAAQRNIERRKRRIERFVERFRAKNTKASQVQSRLKMLERLEDQRPHAPVTIPESLQIRLPKSERSGLEVLRLDHAGVRYDGGATWVFRGVDLRIERGERVAVVGRNGAGKTTLLRVMAGVLPLTEGARRLGRNVTCGYLAQDHAETLAPTKTVLETALDARRDPDMTRADVRAFLGAFRFGGTAVEKTTSVLSGGEKVRLRLACALLRAPNFLLLDEPTTHLDIPSREALERALQAYSGTLCLVSHDVEFVRHIADSIIFLDGSGMHRIPGGYDDFRERLAAEEAARAKSEGDKRENIPREPPPAAPADRRAARRREARRRQEFYQRRKPLEDEIARLEDRVQCLEQEKEQLVSVLTNPGEAVDYKNVNRRLAELTREIAELTERWENAALALEQLVEAFAARADSADMQPTGGQ